MKTKFFLAFLLASLCSYAQKDSVSGPHLVYHNTLMMGLLAGDDTWTTSASASTAHGLRYQNLAVALGFGYDTYPNWNTMPIFASVGYDVLKRKDNILFVQYAFGYARAWKREDESDPYRYDIDQWKPMHHPTVGYSRKVASVRLYVALGYKVQYLHYQQTPTWWSWADIDARSRTTVDRRMARFTLHLGFGLH